MFDYNEIENQVIEYITANGAAEPEEFDIESIMDELRDMGIASIDEVDIDELLIAFPADGDGSIEDAYGASLQYDPEKGGWYIWIDDPASDDIMVGAYGADRATAARKALRVLGNSESGADDGLPPTITIGDAVAALEGWTGEVQVSCGRDGSGWTDGETFDDLGKAVAYFDELVLEHSADADDYHTVTLSKTWPEEQLDDGDEEWASEEVISVRI